MKLLRIFCLVAATISLIGVLGGIFYRQDYGLGCMFAGVAALFALMTWISGPVKK